MLGNLHVLVAAVTPLVLGIVIWFFRGHKELKSIRLFVAAVALFNLCFSLTVLIQMLHLAIWRTYGWLWFIFVLSHLCVSVGAVYLLLDIMREGIWRWFSRFKR